MCECVWGGGRGPGVCDESVITDHHSYLYSGVWEYVCPQKVLYKIPHPESASETF